MEPNLKLVLDEIRKSKDDLNRRFDEHNDEWNRRFSDLNHARADCAAVIDKRFEALETACADIAIDIGKRVADLEAVRVDHINSERDDRVAALEAVATDLGSWRPEVEALVDDLKIEVKKLSQAHDRKVFDPQPQWLNVGVSPTATSSHAPAGATIETPSGHGAATSYRDVGSGPIDPDQCPSHE